MSKTYSFSLGNKIILLLILFFAIMALGSCSEYTVDKTSFPELSGTILMWGRDNIVFDVVSGRESKYSFEYKRFTPFVLAQCAGDTLIMKYYDIFKHYNALCDGNTNDLIFCKYKPFDSQFVIIPELSKGNTSIYSIDGNWYKKEYVISGKYLERRGVFIVDSNYSIVKEYSSFSEERALSVYYLANGALVGCDQQNIYLLDSTNNTFRLITGGYIETVSKNRKFVIIDKGESHKYNRYFLMDDNFNIIDTLKLRGETIRGLCFSPNMKAVAYIQTCGILGDLAQICIYDIQKEKYYRTDVVGKAGTLTWLDM